MNEAKRALFEALRLDPTHKVARARLQEIRDQELQALLQTEDSPKKLHSLRKKPGTSETDEKLALEQLWVEWHGSESKEWTDEVEELRTLELFLEEKSLTTVNYRAEDWLELALAAFEMEFSDWSRALLNRARLKDQDEKLFLKIALIEARIDFHQGRYYFVLQNLRPVLLKRAVEMEERLECAYWVARSQEALGEKTEALGTYREIAEKDSQFRDVAERIQECLKK